MVDLDDISRLYFLSSAFDLYSNSKMELQVVSNLRISYGFKDYVSKDAIVMEELALVVEIQSESVTLSLLAPPTFVSEGLFGSKQKSERAHHALMTFRLTGSFHGELKVVAWLHRLRLTLICSEENKMDLSRFGKMVDQLLSEVVTHVLKKEASELTHVAENGVMQTHMFDVDKECKSVSLIEVHKELADAGLAASHAPDGKSVIVRRGLSRVVLYRFGALQVMTRDFQEAEELVQDVVTCLDRGISTGTIAISTDFTKRKIAGVKPEKWRRLSLYVHARLHGYNGPYLTRQQLKEWVQRNVPSTAGFFVDITLGGARAGSWSANDVKKWLASRGVVLDQQNAGRDRQEAFYIAKCLDMGIPLGAKDNRPARSGSTSGC